MFGNRYIKMKWLVILLVGLLTFSFLVSAFDDAQLPLICGGDSELLIGCLGDDELVALGASPFVVGPVGGEIPEEEVILPPEEEPLIDRLFSIIGLDWQTLKDLKVDIWIMAFLILLIIVFIIAGKRRKRCKAKVEGKRCKNKAEKEGYCIIHYKIFKEEKEKKGH